MLVISLSFPAKRFHATPWGRQVNEGAVEWPPSPWRLLRSLVAVWHHKFSDVPESAMRELIDALSAPPMFALPPASQGHTRHYMPLVSGDRTKVFDTFVAVDPDDAILALWPGLELSSEQRGLLVNLLGAMNYFGRAESWVCAELLNDISHEAEVQPLELGNDPPSGFELVRTLALATPGDHAEWFKARAQAVAAVPIKARKGKAGTSKSSEWLPASLLEALHADTAELRKEGWNQPPGSRWINYARPSNAFAPLPRRRRQSQRPKLPTVARYAVTGAVRPSLTEALSIGEQLRRYVMSQSKKITGNARTVFSGHHDDGSPYHDHHRHAHFLCEAVADRHISHITVFAPMGFERDDELALSRVQTIHRRDGYDLQLVLLGVGEPEEFGGTDEKAGQSPILGKSRVWQSRTPVILARHLKMKRSERHDPSVRLTAMRSALEAYLRWELHQREHLAPFADKVKIEPFLDRGQAGTLLGGHFTHWLKFRRLRFGGGGTRSSGRGYGFRLTFSELVQGPIALGYGGHFGLGQFETD
jgi:CRISPR-associated protein Csb2